MTAAPEAPVAAVTPPVGGPARAPEPAPTKPPEPAPVATPPVATPPVAAKGKLTVNVDASDATIELDGKKIAQATNFVAVDLEEGDHKLVVTAPGRKPSERTVTIAQGVEAKADVKLEKIRAAAARPAGEPVKKPDKPAGGGEDSLVDPFGHKKSK
jgi:hypothetical protein